MGRRKGHTILEGPDLRKDWCLHESQKIEIRVWIVVPSRWDVAMSRGRGRDNMENRWCRRAAVVSTV